MDGRLVGVGAGIGSAKSDSQVYSDSDLRNLFATRAPVIEICKVAWYKTVCVCMYVCVCITACLQYYIVSYIERQS